MVVSKAETATAVVAVADKATAVVAVADKATAAETATVETAAVVATVNRASRLAATAAVVALPPMAVGNPRASEVVAEVAMELVPEVVLVVASSAATKKTPYSWVALEMRLSRTSNRFSSRTTFNHRESACSPTRLASLREPPLLTSLISTQHRKRASWTVARPDQVAAECASTLPVANQVLADHILPLVCLQRQCSHNQNKPTF